MARRRHPTLRWDAGRDFRRVRTASGSGGVLGGARAFPEDSGATRVRRRARNQEAEGLGMAAVLLTEAASAVSGLGKGLHLPRESRFTRLASPRPCGARPSEACARAELFSRVWAQFPPGGWILSGCHIYRSALYNVDASLPRPCNSSQGRMQMWKPLQSSFKSSQTRAKWMSLVDLSVSLARPQRKRQWPFHLQNSAV